MDNRELWEDRFDLYCDEKQLNEEDCPEFFLVRDAFCEAYFWGVSDLADGFLKIRKDDEP